MRRAVFLLTLYCALSALLLMVLGTRMTGIPPLGVLLDPLDGLYRTARHSDAPPPGRLAVPGLTGATEVIWDDRGVPHIFAEYDIDAVAALGYVVARDRLFQLDFLPKAASGRLSEALGPAGLRADRFLRSIGMEWGARMNLARIEREDGQELQLLDAYCRGVNAHLDGLSARDLPFEMRLLGYGPDRCTPIQALRLMQYMNYDLTYRTDDPMYGWMRQRLSDEDYRLLYPEQSDYYVPIIPAAPDLPSDAQVSRLSEQWRPAAQSTSPNGLFPSLKGLRIEMPLVAALLEGYRVGKGSNNWAVSGRRSTTGAPILAGDMHLKVSLPAIWYEAHLVTPSMNTYGVTIPGAPLPVEAFNDYLGWTITNTGTDQIDHYQLQLDSTKTKYWYEDEWRDLQIVRDTILVKGERPVVDTLLYSHWGPVVAQGRDAIALRWVAHDSSRTLRALYGMNRAQTHDDFQEALRYWDTPAQNLLYADSKGIISIRSTGFLPVRNGGPAKGLLDGSRAESEWIGRIPFDELPFAVNPTQGFLSSTNQQPAGASYPYYLDEDWRIGYRSLRIDSLLRSKEKHSVEDLMRYQSDVHAVQRDFLVPFLDTLSNLGERADSLRRMLTAWNGEMSVDRPEPALLQRVTAELRRLTWDEDAFAPAFQIDVDGNTVAGPFPVPIPGENRIFYLLATDPSSKWLDVQATTVREDGASLLRMVLDSAAAHVQRPGELRWGDHRKIRFNFILESETFRRLGRGPFEYPGFKETLSPAADSITTHSASARLVIDFATSPPRGWIVYPGGQSGNPFSRRYDLHLPRYLSFKHYDILKPRSASEMPESVATHRAVIHSASR